MMHFTAPYEAPEQHPTIAQVTTSFCFNSFQMLHDGCSSGPVSVELTYLLPLFSSILTLSVDTQENDAKVCTTCIISHFLSIMMYALKCINERIQRH